jgi:alpha-D-ribose 1-methylphosphonate 5-triphosphate synthase subunit PhnL
MTPLIRVEKLRKSFTLHNQGRVNLPVLSAIDLTACAGECLALAGPSGSGKSSLLKAIYGNYKTDSGKILIHDEGKWINLAAAEPRRILSLRRRTLGYVSQFLRVIPRVPTMNILMDAVRFLDLPEKEARMRCEILLSRLRIPERLWCLSPTTFSGGEQQRVNIARGFVYPFPVLLLDEPTAALDSRNRQTVEELIVEAKNRGAAILGIFHDEEVRDKVADRIYTMPGNGGSG